MNKSLVGLVAVLAVITVAVITILSNKAVKQPGESVSETRKTNPTTDPGESAFMEPTIRPQGSVDIESETEVVHGLRVWKDRNCTVTIDYVPAGDRIATAVYACEPNTPAE